MKKLPMLLLTLLTLSALLTAGTAENKGSLVIMGGGIKSSLDRVYQRFIELGGGAECIRLAIIPAASAEPAVSGLQNAADFVRLGVPADRIRVFPLAVARRSNEQGCRRGAVDRQRLQRGIGQGYARIHGSIFCGRRPDPLHPDLEKARRRRLAPAAFHPPDPCSRGGDRRQQRRRRHDVRPNDLRRATA